jgi:predicted ATPase
MPAGPRWRLEPDGRDAAQVLYSLAELRKQVSGWYREAIGRALDFVDVPPDEFRIVLRNTKRHQALEVDMLDSGQGAIQVLPVLVALALLRERKGPRVLALEEPESHLHGSSQIHLTRAICRAAGAENNTRIAVETHSRHVLLGVQLALLQGELRPEDIIIYWVRQDERGKSSIDPVTLDQDAYLQGVWPDPFVHERDAARSVIEARARRARK